MLPYLLVFAISIFSTYLAQITLKRHNKILFIMFSAIAILVPSLLAGFRDSGIGTDTKIYVDYVWNQFKHINGWGQFLKYYQNEDFQDIEFVYLILNFIASRFGDDVNNIYFLANFVVVIFIYLAAYDNRNRASMCLSMTFFLLLYYNASLNLVRQSIALAMCIYSFKYVEQKKWIKAIIWIFIITKTHNTGIFYVVIIGIYFLFQLTSKYLRAILLIINVVLVLILFSAADLFLVFFVSKGILPDKFLYYLSSNSDSETLTKSVLINYIFLFIVMLLTYFKYNNSKVFDTKKDLSFYAYSKFIGVILFVTSLLSQWAFRISFYINYPADILFFPRSLHLLKEKSKLHYLFFLVMSILMIMVIWYWTIVINNGNETYPYKSKILGI